MGCRTPPTSPMTAYRATRFDRPGFLAMMEEVEAGRVEAIVIKRHEPPGA